MIAVAPSGSYTAFVYLGASGIAGSVGFTVYNANGTVQTARVVGAGITEIGATGWYRKTAVAPATEAPYLVQFDKGALTPGNVSGEELIVSAAGAVNVPPSGTFTSFANLNSSGIAASAGFALYKADGTVQAARVVGTGITEIGSTGWYRKTSVAPAVEASYLIQWDNGSTAVGNVAGDELIVSTATVVPPDPGGSADHAAIMAALAAIRSKTDMLGSGIVVVDLPIVKTEPAVLKLVRGDDYDADQGRAIGWELEGVTTLEGTTVNFRVGISGGAPGLTQLCTVVGPEDLYVELTAAQTAALTAKKYTYELEQTVATKKATLLRGSLEMTDDLSAT